MEINTDRMNKTAEKKFEILEYVSGKDWTIDGLAEKLNELTGVSNIEMVDALKDLKDLHLSRTQLKDAFKVIGVIKE